MLIPSNKYGTFLRDTAAISISAARFGIEPLAKSAYVLGKALAWACQFPHGFDHVLAYWGNYAATCAYLFNRLLKRPLPFSVFLHAGTDLYRKQVFLKQKLHYAQNIIVVCEFNRAFIRELYPDIFDSIAPKIHLHHIGLDLSEFLYEPDNRPAQKVLGVGSLEKPKGFKYLLLAAHQLISQGVDLHVDIVGDGKERNSLEMLARKFEITDKVTFCGWVPPDQVRQIMKQATILVHPSIGIGDAVPTVIKESMALGTPVIASNVAGIPELLNGGKCGMLVPPQNAEVLADAIRALLTGSSIRRRYADAGRKFAEEQFDTWRNGRRLAQVLRSTERPTETVSQHETVLYEG
jgi:glycosyltransferase involved in cell wall biosynthesis